MKKGQKRWTRDELFLVMNLYCQTSFGRMHSRNPDVVTLAMLIERTPGAVAYKLVNFASLDPHHQSRGVKGARNTSKLDREIWDEFQGNWLGCLYQSELLFSERKKESLETLVLDPNELIPEGLERERLVKTRVNQRIFRRMILASYDKGCCITGLRDSRILVAAHIKPWAVDPQNRLNPCNGLAMNALHDRAFENGLITIDQQYRIRISSQLKKRENANAYDYFQKYDHRRIILPQKFWPNPEFLQYHNDERFIP